MRLALGIESKSRLLVAETDSVDSLVVAAHSVRLRANQSIHTGPLVVIVACVCVGLLVLLGGRTATMIWGACVVGGALFNRHRCKRFATLADNTPPRQLARAQLELWALTIMNTLTIGLGVWLVAVDFSDLRILTMIVCIQVLYSLGALINASTHPPTFVSGAAINLGSVFAFALLRIPEGGMLASTLGAVFLLMVRFCKQISAEFAESVRIRFENLDLVRRLEQKTEQEALARASAEAANLAKSRFLAAASHDLRQPLHTLMLFSGLLDRGGANERALFIANIQSAARSLDRLFAELIDLSKLDSGAMSASFSAVRLTSLVGPIISEYEPLANEKQLRINHDCSDLCVSTDPFLFERILRNLLDNALRYTQNGSVRVVAEEKDSLVWIRVSDTGIGIAADEQVRIFDEFYQVGNKARANDKGSGLGLAIVKRLAALLGHELTIESEAGKGTTISIVMPKLNFDSGAGRPEFVAVDQDPHLPQNLTIALIEDDVRVRTAMAAVFSSWQCQSVAMSSYEEVVQLCSRSEVSTIDVVIADYRLGGVTTGFDAINVLKKRFPNVIAAIVTGDLETFPSDIKLQEVPVFRKPMSATAMAQWVRTELSRRQQSEQQGLG